MDGSSKSRYGESWADVYDAWVAERISAEETEHAVATLANLARGGRALELGIGTGRLALPLAKSGISVEGIDASQSMIKRLREKAGSGAITITVDDFSRVAVKGEFDLVFVAFNTLFALSTQEEQVRVSATLPSTSRTTVSSSSRRSFPTRRVSRMAKRCVPCT